MLTIATRLDVMNHLGKALADPTRSPILLSLSERPGYPADLSRGLQLTRSNVSNHLACVRGCGIVVATPEGRQTRYEIADAHLTRALTALVETDAAIESASVAFTGNDLRLLPAALLHARRGRRIMTGNIVLSLGIIIVLLPLALLGILGLAGIVLVHEMAELIVILNGVRAARRPKPITALGARTAAASPPRANVLR